MKKLFIFLALIVVAALSVSSCKEHNNAEQQHKTRKVDTIFVNMNNTNWEVFIGSLMPSLRRALPNYEFYESSGKLTVNEDDTFGVDPKTLKFVFQNPKTMHCAICFVTDSGYIKIEKYDEPWMEDVYMSPYVPMGLNQAIEIITHQVDCKFFPGESFVLRHQMYSGEVEPRMFVGDMNNLHSVSIFSREVDKPLNSSGELMAAPSHILEQKK